MSNKPFKFEVGETYKALSKQYAEETQRTLTKEDKTILQYIWDISKEE